MGSKATKVDPGVEGTESPTYSEPYTIPVYHKSCLPISFPAN